MVERAPRPERDDVGAEEPERLRRDLDALREQFEAAGQVFELLMGSDVAPRKEFLVQGAYEIDAATLDA